MYFYHPDHLGSTAMVTDLDGRITQNVLYIPYGEVFVEERNGSWASPYLFNAKELDEETGLYYYGVRYLDPKGAMWLSVDPLWINHPDKTPYNYCLNNPVIMVDPDGRNGVVTGEGTAEDPYVVTANYYYNPNDFSENPESITGLHSAIQAYNNNGKPWKVVLPDKKGKVFVKMNLNLKESDDPQKSASSEHSNDDYNDLRDVCYGNIVRNSTDSPKKWGGSDGFSISINVNAFKNETGYTFTETIVGVWIHEIGHNLGLTHQDRYDDQHRNRTYIMISPDCHRDPKKTSVPVHPKVDSDGIRIMIQHLNQDGRINFDEPSKVGRIHQFVPSK
ncbi:MAG: RHS repeat-associated core domain-containing protein [Paludibacteraceae bacterium]|nr:RHS repeat-associated core domain-containing protein [Paludibacteraceae bacterium]